MLNIGNMFATFLGWLIQFLLFTPFQVVRLISALLPGCSQFGITGFAAGVSDDAANWIRFLWPVIQYVPWTFLWNFISAIILYIFFKWLWDHMPWILSLGKTFWIIVAAFYVVGVALSVFTSTVWMDNEIFTAIFGVAPTTTHVTGGGFGGGGGGSW